jgi:hypothetical protein
MKTKEIANLVNLKHLLNLFIDMINLDLSQSAPFQPANIPIDRSNAINVRRHIYSPSQLPQGLTEGQLVMLLQKGSQYQQIKSRPTDQPFLNQKEPPVISKFYSVFFYELTIWFSHQQQQL